VDLNAVRFEVVGQFTAGMEVAVETDPEPWPPYHGLRIFAANGTGKKTLDQKPVETKLIYLIVTTFYSFGFQILYFRINFLIRMAKFRR
jgi:hypothetical protein